MAFVWSELEKERSTSVSVFQAVLIFISLSLQDISWMSQFLPLRFRAIRSIDVQDLEFFFSSSSVSKLPLLFSPSLISGMISDELYFSSNFECDSRWIRFFRLAFGIHSVPQKRRLCRDERLNYDERREESDSVKASSGSISRL